MERLKQRLATARQALDTLEELRTVPFSKIVRDAAIQRLEYTFEAVWKAADVVLVMTEDFRLEDAGRESRTLFSHSDADARFGASIFWLRQGMLPEDGMREFLATWQMKRDATLRGMLEVKP